MKEQMMSFSDFQLLSIVCPWFCRGRLHRVRVVCTGALTNVALLVSLYPEVLPRMEIVLMGGAIGIGNTGPVMEFNIQVGRGCMRLQFPSYNTSELLMHLSLLNCAVLQQHFACS